jgi:putative ABC transport system ATP-binding protein
MAAYAKRIVRFVDGVVESDKPNPNPAGLRKSATLAEAQATQTAGSA